MSYQILEKGKASDLIDRLKSQTRAVEDADQFERVKALILAELGELDNQSEVIQIDCQGQRSKTGFSINLNVFGKP